QAELPQVLEAPEPARDRDPALPELEALEPRPLPGREVRRLDPLEREPSERRERVWPEGEPGQVPPTPVQIAAPAREQGLEAGERRDRQRVDALRAQRLERRAPETRQIELIGADPEGLEVRGVAERGQVEVRTGSDPDLADRGPLEAG